MAINRSRKKKKKEPLLPDFVNKMMMVENSKNGVKAIVVEVNLSKLMAQKTRWLKCSECGKEADCRPYGSQGAEICFECGTSPKFEPRTAHNSRVRATKEGELQ